MSSEPAPDPGLKFDRLPEGIRRVQRFGGAAAARLAEAVALRREIDAVAGRLAAWVATSRGTGNKAAGDVGRDDAIMQATWVHLRRAGLALRAEIDQQGMSHHNMVGNDVIDAVAPKPGGNA